jgi:hypothetical protein
MKHETMKAERRPWFAVETHTARPACGFKGLGALHPGQSAGEVAEVLMKAAAEAEIAASRLW